MIAATLRQMAAPVATVKSEIHITSLRRRFVGFLVFCSREI
jgi:hypothetical protein